MFLMIAVFYGLVDCYCCFCFACGLLGYVVYC